MSRYQSATDEEIADRIAALRGDPKVARWIKRFMALARELPDGIEIYCETGTAHVMALTDDGNSFETNSGAQDQRAIIESSRGENSRWDGGGW